MRSFICIAVALASLAAASPLAEHDGLAERADEGLVCLKMHNCQTSTPDAQTALEEPEFYGSPVPVTTRSFTRYYREADRAKRTAPDGDDMAKRGEPTASAAGEPNGDHHHKILILPRAETTHHHIILPRAEETAEAKQEFDEASHHHKIPILPRDDPNSLKTPIAPDEAIPAETVNTEVTHTKATRPNWVLPITVETTLRRIPILPRATTTSIETTHHHIILPRAKETSHHHIILPRAEKTSHHHIILPRAKETAAAKRD